MLLIYLIVFLFGLVAGSFLNCLIYRLETNKGFIWGRSFCPHCKHILSWQDLIPVLSFLILKGKCRYCKKPIALQYPLVELITGILFILILKFAGVQPLYFCYLLIVVCFLIIIFVYDLKHYIIPDKIIYPVIVVSCFWYLVSSILNSYTKYEILNTIYSAIGAAAFFLLIVLLSKGKWMGAGDIKLAFFMGFFLGFPKILVALFFAFFVGATIGILLIISGKKTLKSEVPFGPFLIAGTFFSLFFGQQIISYYQNLLLF